MTSIPFRAGAGANEDEQTDEAGFLRAVSYAVSAGVAQRHRTAERRVPADVCSARRGEGTGEGAGIAEH
jgi:hypothetical protein